MAKSKDTVNDEKDGQLKITAIGAPEKSLESLQILLSRFPEMDDACLVVYQTISRALENKLVNWVRGENHQVKMAEMGERIQPQRVYIPPSGYKISIENNEIQLTKTNSALTDNEPSLPDSIRPQELEQGVIKIDILLSGSKTFAAEGELYLKASLVIFKKETIPGDVSAKNEELNLDRLNVRIKELELELANTRKQLQSYMEESECRDENFLSLQEEVQHSNKEFQSSLLESANKLAKIGSWELDLHIGDDMMYWSEMTRKILEVGPGYNPSLSGGFEFYTEESKTRIKTAVDHLVRMGKPFDEELLIRTAKGNTKWIRCIGDSVRVDGVCTKIFGSYQDIHDLKTALEARTKTLESIQDGFYALDKNWTVTYWNQEAERLLQVKREDIIGKNIWEEFKEAVSRKFFREYHRALKEKVPVRFEEYFPPLSGWYDVSAFPADDGLTVYFKEITYRKKTEIELIQFQKIIESSRDGIALADQSGNTLYLNPGFSEMLGYNIDRLAEIGGPKAVYSDRKLADKVFSELLSGNHWRGDIELLNGNGETLSFYLSGGPIFDEDGRQIAIYGIHTDITQRKKAEKELLKSYEERNNILESIGDAFFAVNTDWTVTYWNKEAEKFLRRPRKEIIGKNLWDVYKDAIDLEFFRQYHRAMESGVAVTFEEHYPTLQKWFDVSAYPSDKGLSVYFKDISIRKQAEKEILQSNERFEKITEATNDAIWDWDVENGLLYWGKGFKTLFGYDYGIMDAEIGIWSQLIHPKDREAAVGVVNDVFNKNAINKWQQEYRFKKEDGTYASVIDRGLVIRDKNGKALRMVGAISDITQRKQFESSLKKLNNDLANQTRLLKASNSELEQFAFVASHDLQEPLRMVTSFLTQLDQQYGDQLDERGKKFIGFAVDGAKRMRRLILDLLEFSRAGRLEGNRMEVDIQGVVADVCSLLRDLIRKKSAKISYDGLPIIVTNRVAITQIFQNIISNALKYSQNGKSPEITVSVENKNRYWQFSIQDNGIGIDEYYHDKIFVIFQRLHRKEEFEGTGMGLAIVKKLVEGMGGEINVKSGAGRGTTFIFTLPKAVKIRD